MSETPPSEAAIQTAARLLAAGQAAEATARLQQLVDAAPTYAAAHVLLASALDASGRPQDALEAWRRAAFLVPHSPLVHRERQRLMNTLGTIKATPEAPAPTDTPVEAWDEEPSSTPSTEDALAPPEEAPASDDAEPSDDASPFASPPDPAEATSADEVETPPEPRGSETPIHSPDEPVEMPLLPPEGDAPPPPSSPVLDLDLDDDGWTILEDDVAPPGADAPTPTPVLSPEPDDTFEPASTPEPLTDAPPLEPDSSIADELDDLISQLDAAPRIKPDPTFEGPKVTFDESGMDDLVSETLAKIYAAQHQYAEAAVVYEKLAEREPDHANTHLERASEMREKAR